MILTKTDRGFEQVEHGKNGLAWLTGRLIAQSSAINPDQIDAIKNPGSSYLWIADQYHLNRDEVKELITRLQAWLDTGSLKKDGE